MKFSARIQHTKETIFRLSKIQYDNFQLGTKLVWLGIIVATLLGAVYSSENQMLFYILLFVVCWLITNVNMPSKHRAEKIVEAANGNFPCTEFQFHEDHVNASSGDYSASVPYSDLYALLEDSEYFYLFINRRAGYMVPKNSVTPDDSEAFRHFLQEKSGLRIQKPTSLFNISLPRIWGLNRKRTKK